MLGLQVRHGWRLVPMQEAHASPRQVLVVSMSFSILREGYPTRHSCVLPYRRTWFRRIKPGTVVRCDQCGVIREWRCINNRWQWGASNFKVIDLTHNCNDHAPDMAHESQP